LRGVIFLKTAAIVDVGSRKLRTAGSKIVLIFFAPAAALPN